MSITTLDGVLAGMQQPYFFTKAVNPQSWGAGKPFTHIFTGGAPPAMTAPSMGIGGGTLSAPVAGQIPFTNPVSGYSYLARLAAQGNFAGQFMLCDLLWWNSGINVTSTSEQTFTGSGQIPARDINGSNNGVGVYGGLLVSADNGAGTPTATLKYEDDAGASSANTTTNIDAIAATGRTGQIYRFGLAAGTKGIRRAVSLTLSATMTSGTIHVILYRPIAMVEIIGALVTNAVDALSGGFPRIYDDSVLFPMLIASTATTSVMAGQIIIAQG